jgi:hypothetical protein
MKKAADDQHHSHNPTVAIPEQIPVCVHLISR